MDDLDGKSDDALWIATRRAILLGVASTMFCMVVGKPIGNSAVDGLIVTIGGMIAWTTYHFISHRSDALLMLAMNNLPIWRRSDDPLLPTLVISCLAMLGVGLVMGIVNRPQAMGDPGEDFAWWDAEMDGPR